MGTRDRRRVVPERLRWHIPPAELPGAGAARPWGLREERAVAALELGATITGWGYNVFAVGPPGSGRTRSVREVLTRIAGERPTPPDRAYVHNFSRPSEPRLLTLPAGDACKLGRSMERFQELMRSSLTGFFDDETVTARRKAIAESYERRQADTLRELERDVEAQGFALVQIQAGQVTRPEIVPVDDGKPVPLEQLREKLSTEEALAVEARIEALRSRLADAVRAGRVVLREMNQALEAMVREEAEALLAGPIADIEEAYASDQVRTFLAEVRADVAAFLTAPFDSGTEQHTIAAHVERYAVNVVCDRTGQTGGPVIVENYPTPLNLFGGVTVQVGADGSAPKPPGFDDIIGGSMLAADGGFLVLRARDVLTQQVVWETLTRTLSTETLEIQRPTAPGPLGLVPSVVKPEPIPVTVRVVLVGDPGVYELLWANDPDFRNAFKVKAEFDSTMFRTEDNLADAVRVLDALRLERSLRPLTADAVARVLEWSARRAGGRGRILARYAESDDLLREADWEAQRAGSDTIDDAAIDAVLSARRWRNGRAEERTLELITEDVVRIQTTGSAVGQVNGLAVLDLGYHRFGKPTRITASASVGRSGIISIEREANLSGGIYDKGVLIITGFLRRRYAQDRNLTVTASLCFEQSYAGVDGDSASIAEIVALLSELAEIGIDQGVAITGSIDQHGGLQPIGGLNEKVEGFFDVCARSAVSGLTGQQGVMFPASNLAELNLRSDVAAAVEAGRFSLWAIETIDDAIEIALGSAPADVDRLVRAKLDAYDKALAESTADVPPAAPVGSASGTVPGP